MFFPLLIAVTIPLSPAQEQESTWSNTAHFSWVATSGNSDAQTVGFQDKLTKAWERHELTVEANAVRSESVTGGRSAEGTRENFTVMEPPRETSAENYYLRGKLDGKISGRSYWTTSIGWERNRFSGIENRYSYSGGLGTRWFDRERLQFRTEYAATFTDQEDVVEAPGVDGTYSGFRLTSDFRIGIGETMSYSNIVRLDGNLEETDDLRAEMTNSFSVKMTGKTALEVSLRVLFDNQPAFEKIPLFDAMGDQIDTVFVQLDEVDTIFTTSLVVNF